MPPDGGMVDGRDLKNCSKYLLFMVLNGCETLPKAQTTLKGAPEHKTFSRPALDVPKR